MDFMKESDRRDLQRIGKRLINIAANGRGKPSGVHDTSRDDYKSLAIERDSLLIQLQEKYKDNIRHRTSVIHPVRSKK